MPEWLEFHDSTLTAVTVVGRDLELTLEGYVHRWVEEDGAWKGEGWARPILIRVVEATVLPTMEGLPLLLDGGWLRTEAGRVSFPQIPAALTGPVELYLDSGEVAPSARSDSALPRAEGDVFFRVRGSGLTIRPVGEGRFIEQLPADMRPDGLEATGREAP